MSSVLTFKFMTTEFLFFLELFPVIQKITLQRQPVTRYSAQNTEFFKMKPCEAVFVGKMF